MRANPFYQNGIAGRVRRYLLTLSHAFYIDANPDVARTILICGVSRSGATWLAELLNYANEYRFMVEPFTREHVRWCRHFGLRQYLRPDDLSPKYLGPARAVFSGRVRTGWVDQSNRRLLVHQRLIKDDRSSLMLKWIRAHFPKMKIVFFVRHPNAVAVSKVKLGWKLDLHRAFLSQDTLLVDHLRPFETEIRAARSGFEQHTVAWCVEHYVPFRQLHNGDVHLIFYENLATNPEYELRRLFAYLEKPFDERILLHTRKPSVTVRIAGDKSAILSGESLIDTWRKDVSAQELAYSKRITHRFGLHELYGDDVSPNVNSADELLSDAVIQA
jgi:hypothetical protein